jgi:hypothetical protein
MSNYKINPMTVAEINALLGKNFVKRFQKEMNAIIRPLRKHIEKGRPLSMGKELWEYVVSDAIEGAEWNGAGHSLIDVKLGNGDGIDVKSVSKSIKSKNTTEASMFQNFNQDAKTHFKNKDSHGVWEIYVDGWCKKVDSFNQYYLIGIIREKETLNCSLCCFSVSKGSIPFTEENARYTNKSIKISGLANPDFINVRYYNSKSRLEILFTDKCWSDPKYCLPIFKF